MRMGQKTEGQSQKAAAAIPVIPLFDLRSPPESAMQILFLTTPEEDYLQDSVLYGLRMLLGESLVDYPRKEVMYKTCPRKGNELYGNGFTIWKLLDEIEVDRDDIVAKLKSGYFDRVIFGSVCRQTNMLMQLLPVTLRQSRKLVFLDGEDSNGFRKKQMLGALCPYYKREQLRLGRLFARPISFSIPRAKIITTLREKQHMFARHVQCDEAYKIPLIRDNCQKSYAFACESDYRRNIAQSYYAVTMKKAGWDCMRHYEIAASGTVMAFYNLAQKPVRCAPHGLIDMENVIAFSSAEELQQKISHITKTAGYQNLRACTLEWAFRHSCEEIAAYIIGRC